MVDFAARIVHVSPTGVTTRVEGQFGGSVALGAFVRDDITHDAPGPLLVARTFATLLAGPRSLWPAAGQTRNRGPYASGVSARAFTARQSRDARGRFGHVVLTNDARNRRGQAYAGWVDQGIRSGGGTVSPGRYRANHRAVARTWDDQSSHVVSLAREAQR